jgi:hypothetical protein
MRSLISDEYRALQQVMHENPGYGVAALHYAPIVVACMDSVGAREVLDYGCGKGRLAEALRAGGRGDIVVRFYDPAIPKFAAPPAPCDFVACIDVLEHIEPECLDAVLDDLQRVTRRWILMTVATRLAEKLLPDGRNAHLIIQPYKWWLPKLEARWALRTMQESQGEFFVFMAAHEPKNNDAPQL